MDIVAGFVSFAILGAFSLSVAWWFSRRSTSNGYDHPRLTATFILLFVAWLGMLARWVHR
jgi:hypothetical protein